MGIRFKKRQLVDETVLMICKRCNKAFSKDYNYCPDCGAKLKSSKTKIIANYGAKGLTSFSYVLPNGMTLNSKNGMSMPLGNGLSFTTK